MRLPLLDQTKENVMRKFLLAIAAIAVQASPSFAQNPLPNAGFEAWTQYNGGIGSTYREPDGWNSANQCSQQIGTYSVTRTDVAHSGSYAVELRTRSAFIGNIKINGLLTTATILCGLNTGGQEGGIASSLIPDSIAFWYKYAPVGSDTAYVQVLLFNGEDTVSDTRGKISVAQSAWTRASFAIPAPTATPTVISTLFNSSWGDGSLGQAEVNSTFTIDDVEFIFATGVNEAAQKNAIQVYPNPVQDILNVSNSNGGATVLEIIDATGRSVMTRTLSGANSRLDVSTLPNGLYMYQLRSTNRQVLRTGKFLKGQ
jgi:hypothetical protein